MSEFPIGQTLDRGTWTITECIVGEPERGRYRARDRKGTPAIVTVAYFQKKPIDTAHYVMPVHRIAPFMHAGRIETTLGKYDGLVEAEPGGRPLRDTTPSLADGVAIVIDACTIASEAHRSNIILRGLRPELIYVDGARITSMLPRCEEFMSTSTPPSVGVLHPFSHFYLAPEILRASRPVLASDVFSLGAILAELATGEHPFLGDYITESLNAICANRRRPWRGPARLGEIVDRAVAADAAARPSADELAELLRGYTVSQ